MNTLFDEVKNLSRSRQIVDKFRKAIADGTLKIGDKLPPERQLCLELGVSRTSLREAIRILDAYGVLEATQGNGTYVTDKFTENVFEFLGFGNILNKENLKHLLQTRLALETGAVEHAIEAADEAALTRIESLVEELEKETNVERLGYVDAQFHEAIVELSGNLILTAIYRMIFKMLIQGTSKVITYPTAREIAVRDHKRILEALKKRNKKACKSLVKSHLENTEKLIETYFHEEG
jgi:GntR family transcriptional repressor for pyruvate dehydrogenase complex